MSEGGGVVETEARSRSNRLVVMRRTKQSLGYRCNRGPKIRMNGRQVNVMLWNERCVCTMNDCESEL